jgi:hypothetical protein
MHAICASLTKAPELLLEQSEAKILAENIANVAQYYPDRVLTEKQTAWIGLGSALAAVYGTRYFAFIARRQKERVSRAAPAETSLNVVPMSKDVPFS